MGVTDTFNKLHDESKQDKAGISQGRSASGGVAATFEAMTSGRSEAEQPEEVQTLEAPDYQESYESPKQPGWMKEQLPGIEEAFNPAEIFASIFSGGLYSGMKIGGRFFMDAARRAGVEASVGTLTDIPLSLASQTVREKYGWLPATALELSGGLAMGMTVDDFLVKRLVSAGKSVGKLADFSKIGSDERESVLKSMEESFNLADDAPNLRKQAAKETGDEEPLDFVFHEEVQPIREWRKADDIARREASAAAAREKQKSAMRRSINLDKELSEVKKTDELSDTARKVKAQAEELSKKKQKEVEESFREESLAREEAPPADLTERRRGIESGRITVAPGMRQEVTERTPETLNEIRKSKNRIDEAKTSKKIFEKQKYVEDFPKENAPKGKYDSMPEPMRTMAIRAEETSRKYQKELYEIVDYEDMVDEEAAIAGINKLRRENGFDEYQPNDNIRVGNKNAQATDSGTILKTDGKPYKSQKSAEQAIKRKGLEGSYQVEPYGDGFSLKAISEDVAETSTKTAPAKSDPAKKVDISEREALIRKIAAERGATQPDQYDELRADITQLSDELEPKYDFEVPPAPKRPKQVEDNFRAQKDIEEFLGESLDNFEGGAYKAGKEGTEGYDSDVSINEDEFLSLDELEEVEESTRDLGDVLNDVYNVFSGKIGFTVDDVSKNADRSKVESAKRLTKDLKRHYQQALRSGIEIEQFYIDSGFDESTAYRLGKLARAVSKKEVDPFQELHGDFMDRPLRYLSVEYPWRKLDAPEVGFAFKNFNSLRDLFETEGVRTVGQMTKRFGLKDSDWSYVALKQEDPNLDLKKEFGLEDTQIARVSQAAKYMDDYLKKSFDDLKKEGVLAKPFPESYVARLEAQKAKVERRLQEGNLRPGPKAKQEEKVSNIQSRIDQVKNLNYSPILRSWLRDLANSNPSQFNRILKMANQQERKVPSIRWLIDNELVDPATIDASKMIGHYARRKGKDIANQRIINALEESGFAKRVIHRDELGNIIKKDKHKQRTGIGNNAPMYNDFIIDGAVSEYLHDFHNSVGHHSKFENMMNSVKMAQFFNPVIMPMYDMYQSVFKTHKLNSWRLPKHIADGIIAFRDKNELYYEAAENVVFSKPFSNPIGSWNDMIENAKLPMNDRMKHLLNPMPHKAIKNYYNMAFNTAWGLDQIVRLASYQELKRRGFSPRKAGQTAALFHGDYASVPPGTRRKLNKLLFTPTFKIAMAKSYTEMVKGTIDVGQNLAKKQLPSKKSRYFAGGLLGLAAANLGKDMLMNNLGFEADQWGRRYTKEIDTDEGPREVNVTFSDPTNLPLKFYHMIAESFEPGQPGSPLGRFMDSAKYELHPFIRVLAGDLANNKRPDGSRIYSPGDSGIEKAGKGLKYLVEQYVPVTQVFGIGDEDAKDKEALNETFGKYGKKLLNLVAFTYVRGPEERRKQYQIENIRKSIYRDAMEDKLDEDNLRRYNEMIDGVIESD